MGTKVLAQLGVEPGICNSTRVKRSEPLNFFNHGQINRGYSCFQAEPTTGVCNMIRTRPRFHSLSFENLQPAHSKLMRQVAKAIQRKY